MKMLRVSGQPGVSKQLYDVHSLVCALGGLFDRYEYTLLFAVVDEPRASCKGRFDLDVTLRPTPVDRKDLLDFLSSVVTFEGLDMVGHLVRPMNMPTDESIETRMAWFAGADLLFETNPPELVGPDDIVDRALEHYNGIDHVTCRMVRVDSMQEFGSGN